MVQREAGQGQRSTRIGNKLKPRRRRPLSVEHRQVGGTGEGAYCIDIWTTCTKTKIVLRRTMRTQHVLRGKMQQRRACR